MCVHGKPINNLPPKQPFLACNAHRPGVAMLHWTSLHAMLCTAWSRQNTTIASAAKDPWTNLIWRLHWTAWSSQHAHHPSSSVRPFLPQLQRIPKRTSTVLYLVAPLNCLKFAACPPSIQPRGALLVPIYSHHTLQVTTEFELCFVHTYIHSKSAVLLKKNHLFPPHHV